MSPETFYIKFRGVRGGYPMPGTTTLKYGGNTTCFEVRASQHLIIVDGGTGIISLGQEMLQAHRTRGEPLQAVLLFTHLHHDHTQGMPFFVPLRHPEATLYIYGAAPSETHTLQDELYRAVIPPVFPLGTEELFSRQYYEHIRDGDCLVLTDPALPPVLFGLAEREALQRIPPDAVTIRVHHGYHHPRAGVLIFRISYLGRSLVIATDTEGYVGGDQKLIAFAREADLLVHDAEYDEHEYAATSLVRQGWGHSTWRMAVEVAQQAQVKRLALHHHNPNHDDAYLEDMERRARELFPATFMAQEGQVVALL